MTPFAISTKVFDLNGSVYIPHVVQSSSNMNDYRRRLTRQATLDTGTYIDDRGYFPGDRTIDVSVQDDKSLFEQLRYIIQNYASILIMLPDGAFTGNMQRLTHGNGRISISLLIETDA